MSNAPTPNVNDQASPEEIKAHRDMYSGMMDFGFVVGLPVGGAIAMFIALLLIKAGIIVSFGISFFAWLGLLGISKTFFVHNH